MVLQSPRRSLSWMTFISPFKADFWLALSANLAICATALTLTTRYGYGNKMALSFGDGLAMCLQSVMGIGSGSEPSRLSSRSVFLAVLIAGTVIWASYQVNYLCVC